MSDIGKDPEKALKKRSELLYNLQETDTQSWKLLGKLLERFPKLDHAPVFSLAARQGKIGFLEKYRQAMTDEVFHETFLDACEAKRKVIIEWFFKLSDRQERLLNLNYHSKRKRLGGKSMIALIIATRLNDEDLVDALLERGASPKEKDEFGGTALFYAKQKKFETLQKKLEQAGSPVAIRRRSSQKLQRRASLKL